VQERWYNRTMQGTTTGCTAPNLVNQTMTATPATTCSGSNYLGQTIQGTQSVFTVTFPPGGTTSLPTGSEPNWADEWAKYLHTTDINGSTTDNVGGQLGAPGQQNITIFTVDVFKDNRTPADPPHVQHGKTRRRRLLPGALGSGHHCRPARHLQERSRRRAACSRRRALPVSATNRAQNANQVFFGLFRPDGDANPRWYGNLKRYQVARSGPDFILADSLGTTPSTTLRASSTTAR